MGECCAELDANALPLINDSLHEVFGRVDGVTLAAASCTCSTLRSLANDERTWERVCNLQWPSTKEPEVKSLITSSGGFQKYYSKCFPLIINKQPFVFHESDTTLKYAEDWFDDEEDMVEELMGTSPDDFISIVDVVFKGRSVASRVLHGIPGADDFHGWFSNCPFRIDVLSHDVESDDETSSTAPMIREGLPLVVSIEKERKDGCFWKALHEEVRVSWILVNKKNMEMANLASWRPLGGQRHWPGDKDFLLRFASILPAHRLLSRKVIQCNVILKCRIMDSNGTSSSGSGLMVTELSMQLEDMGGAHLNGRHSLLVLMEALSCRRSMRHHEVLKSYHQYLKAQSDIKEERNRSEGRVDTACIVCGILFFLLICYFMFFS